MFKYIKSIFLDDGRYLCICFTVFSAFLQIGLIADFRLLTVATGVMILLLNQRLKQLFLSAFLVTLFVLPIFSPNKYYIIEIIPGSEILEPLYKAGYSLGYGLNIANILIWGSILLSILIAYRSKKSIFDLLHLFPASVILTVCGFLVIGLGASLNFSPFKDASIVWLLQYFQLFGVAYLLLYFFKFFSGRQPLFYLTILLSIFFQLFLALRQFLSQSFIGLPIERGFGSFFATGLDELNTLYRVAGSFAFHNQLALITLLLIIIITPKMLRSRSTWYLLGSIAGGVIIVLTQSRSVWIAGSITLLITWKMYAPQLRSWIKSIHGFKIVFYVVALVMFLSWIVIPRLSVSVNAIYEGAGIPARLKLLDEGIQAFLQNPWLGYGIGTNEYILHSLFPNGITTIWPTAIHFGLLQLALEVGVVGVASFLYPFVYVLRYIVNSSLLFKTKIRSKKTQNAHYIFLSGALIFFIYYLFLPHVGIIEFPYLGLVLGYGLAITQKIL